MSGLVDLNRGKSFEYTMLSSILHIAGQIHAPLLCSCSVFSLCLPLRKDIREICHYEVVRKWKLSFIHPVCDHTFSITVDIWQQLSKCDYFYEKNWIYKPILQVFNVWLPILSTSWSNVMVESFTGPMTGNFIPMLATSAKELSRTTLSVKNRIIVVLQAYFRFKRDRYLPLAIII